MTWNIDKDLIKDEKGNIVCILMDNINTAYPKMMIKAPDVVDLIGEFVMNFDERKTMSKALFNKFCLIVKDIPDFDVKWTVNNSSDIEDEGGKIICVFIDKVKFSINLIRVIPEMVMTIKELIKNFNSNNSKQKDFYNRFCDLQDSLHD